MCRAYTHGAVVRFQLGIEHFTRSNPSLHPLPHAVYGDENRKRSSSTYARSQLGVLTTALKLEANDHSADFSTLESLDRWI